RRLDEKLARIRANDYRPQDFIIADAKDGEMGFGVHVAGPAHDSASGQPSGFKPYLDYQQAMREMTRSELVDIMLMAASTAQRLTGEGLFEESRVTPAIRLNDTTDIWSGRGCAAKQHPSRPFRSADVARARKVADLGLYSVTFYNDIAVDVPALAAYAAFREEALACNMRHFLEVFAPAFAIDTGDASLADYMNDTIVRGLAGLVHDEMPLFLKIPFLGARAMEELASYDPQRIIVGMLGGSSGTTRDTFELIAQGERYGARVALFGRKINLSEDPIALVSHMRRVLEDRLSPKEAVSSYHAHLQARGVTPIRPLDDDLQVSEAVLQPEAQS
ncbi:MAG: hypothetical protein ACTSYE_12170, partial [Alphaproteobacteria bacterium]